MARIDRELLSKYVIEIVIVLGSLFIAVVTGVIFFAWCPAPGDSSITAYAALWISIFLAICIIPLFVTLKMSIELTELRAKSFGSAGNGHSKSFRPPGWDDTNDIVRTSGMGVEKEFNERLTFFKGGYEVRGEDWSLSAYEIFWNRLVERQQMLSGRKGTLVVRITHANDIGIWDPEQRKDRRIDRLYEHQKKFIEYGGCIVRILLHRGEANETYKSVLTRMLAVGIEARLLELTEADAFSYDFLWVCDSEHSGGTHAVVKWISAAGGIRLASCEVHDSCNEEVRRIWGEVAGRSERQDGPITKIPANRQTY